MAQAWTKYRVPVVSAAAGLLAAVAAYQGWTFWHSSAVETSSRQFEAVIAAPATEPAQAKILAMNFAKLANDGAGGYPFLARFHEAAARVVAGETKSAVSLYDRIADDTSEPLFADYARIRAAMLLVDTAPIADIEKRLKPLAESESPWRIEAEEFLAYAYWRAGNNKEALRLFDLIKNNPGASEGAKRRATELSALINGGTKVADLKTAPVVAPSPGSQLPQIPGMPSFDTTPITPSPPSPFDSAPAPTPTP